MREFQLAASLLAKQKIAVAIYFISSSHITDVALS